MTIDIDTHVHVRPAKPLDLSLASEIAPSGEALAELLKRNESETRDVKHTSTSE